MDEFELPFLNSYLDSVGFPSFRRGCNFAAAGSTILPATATSVSPFSFGIQVAQFFRFKDRVLELLAKSMFRFQYKLLTPFLFQIKVIIQIDWYRKVYLSDMEDLQLCF